MTQQSLPTLNSLRAFEVSARHLSFSKAAEELHVTPAAVSQQVKVLEDHLGVVLFHRLNRGLALTSAGMAGLPQLQQAFCALQKGVEKMRGSREAELLAVQSAPSFAAKWLLARMPGFAVDHPDIDLRLAGSLDHVDSESNRLTVRERFRNGEITVGIRFGRGDYPGCRADRLFGVSAMLLCSPSLMAGKHPLLSPQDLKFHTLLHDDTPWEGRPDWKTWMAAAGVTDMDVKRGPHFIPVQLVHQAAMEGQGVALCIDVLAADDIAAGRLVSPFGIRVPVSGAYFLVCLEESSEEPTVVAFRDWMLRQAKEFRELFPESLTPVSQD